MTKETYRALTFVSLALVAVNLTQRQWLYTQFSYEWGFIPWHDEIADGIIAGWGTTLSALLTVGLAYLWTSTKNSN